ncbi:phosphatidate cytidylyltransferase [Anaerosalibacter massiliensis]|uniref:Phosphatidate cytidylyltransferase n=1 Tax=Anaerosalibacter massiliensis TaxID=1347392 RepID=A0A9X2S686_9FIRM|nr:phosphatidate cytidylyltransferase [Anaerosalibacter massiliensis]MCR2042736.1 phosphatidate cytidylyltransferase [Anaerosalibacter massiliensis]
MKELIIRSISGLIGIILLVLIASKGGLILNIGIMLVSFVGVYEFYNATNMKGFNPIKTLGYIFSIGLFINNIKSQWLSLNFLIFIILIAILILLILKKNFSIQDVGITLLGLLYIPFLIFHITYLDKSIYIWFIFIIAWGTDTFAYIAGNLFGKKKLCPNLSPNKTVEGSIGGIIGSVLLIVIFSKYFNLASLRGNILLSIIASIMAQIGDLTASKIKRITGIKDFGYIIPGHGGVLDRFDSILFTAPVVYYFVKYFIF